MFCRYNQTCLFSAVTFPNGYDAGDPQDMSPYCQLNPIPFPSYPNPAEESQPRGRMGRARHAPTRSDAGSEVLVGGWAGWFLSPAREAVQRPVEAGLSGARVQVQGAPAGAGLCGPHCAAGAGSAPGPRPPPGGLPGPCAAKHGAKKLVALGELPERGRTFRSNPSPKL